MQLRVLMLLRPVSWVLLLIRSLGDLLGLMLLLGLKVLVELLAKVSRGGVHLVVCIWAYVLQIGSR